VALAFSSTGAHARASAQLSLHDGLIWADVECSGQTLHFVVDTGAASSCVNLAAARRLGIQMRSSLSVAGVGGGTTGYRCTGFNGSVDGMRLPAEVVALDLSGPARCCSQPIDGLIGADFFRGRIVRIDYARKLLSLVDAAPARGIDLLFANGVICVPVAVNGGDPRWTRLDTGCTDALDWCEASGTPAQPHGKTVALAGWLGSASCADVTVGRAHLAGVPVRMHAREIFPGEAGLLGNGVLSRYRVTIDGIAKRLVLEGSRETPPRE